MTQPISPPEKDPPSAQKRTARRVSAGLIVALLVVGLGLGLWKSRPETETTAVSHPGPEQSQPASSRPAGEIAQPAKKLPGEMIMEAYGSHATRPQDDLHSVAHALANLALLIKGNDPFRLGANEEFAAALRGKNRNQLRFLPDDHPSFNDKGQLVDRWKTPLYIHASSHDRLEIRSAGPDKKMWTEDDLQRQSDGQFLKGKDLNPTSLYTPATPR